MLHHSRCLDSIYVSMARKRAKYYEKLPDDVYLKKFFKENTGEDLDLINPQTFNQKVQWLK